MKGVVKEVAFEAPDKRIRFDFSFFVNRNQSNCERLKLLNR